MALQPSWKGNLGIAKEAVAGTAVAPTAFIPVNAITPKRVITQLDDNAWRGSAVDQYGQVQGPWHSEIDIPGDVYPDSFGWFLAAIFGDVVTTAIGAGVNQHRFAVLNSGTMQPTTKTLTDYYVANARAYANGVCVELTVKFTADGKLTYTSKWISKAEAAVATPVAAYTTTALMPGWRAAPTINGVTPKLLDYELSLKRTYDVVNVANNSQDPISIFLGPLSAEGKATVIMEDDTYLTNFYNNTQGAIVVAFNRGAGATLESVGLACNLAAIREGNIDRSSSYVKFPFTFRGLGNVTDAGASLGLSNASAVVSNTLAAGTYN